MLTFQRVAPGFPDFGAASLLGMPLQDWGLGTGNWEEFSSRANAARTKLGWGLNPRTIFPVPSP
ncbi:MAG: hypothetical protein V7L11_08610 [Nostoc sp.]|uniref:hypothetical protein n=1 Tax=Nostoc sp. TaxID=1180 RepID=UPI002FFB772A